MATLKASQQGLAHIKQARSEKGWATSDFRWIEAASGVLGASWVQDGVLAVGISEGTWKRFLAGKYPINAEAFKAYCQVLGLNWEKVVEQNLEEAGLYQNEQQLSTALQNSPVIMFNQDRELRYTWIYNNSKEAYGASESEIIGKRDIDLLSAEESEMLAQIKLEVMETGIEAREEVKLNMGGQHCYFDLIVKPLRAASGEIMGVTCTAIDITQRKQLANASHQADSNSTFEQATVTSVSPQVDWGEAPDASIFYGRQAELDTVRQWIVQENCRLVTLLGMGGIGKTALSVKLAKEIVESYEFSVLSSELSSSTQNSKLKTQNFEYVIWRSLRNAPPVEEMLAEFIQFLSEQQETSLATNLENRIARLLHYLRTCRCLLILDNAESILQAGDRTGRYRTGYEGYGQLLGCIAETNHQSCLILTSREKPQGLAKFEGESLPVRSLQLSGLPEVDSRELFNVKGIFTATEAEWQTLISRYAGNPLALKIVASSIHDYFESDISYFLDTTQQGAFLFDDIRDLLEQQFQRLTDLERDIMYWLAIDREPVTLPELQANFIVTIPPREVLESLNSLQRRSLIEKNGTTFTQQPVVMEYVTTQLIESVCEEIEKSSISKIQNLKSKIFITHALLKAIAKDYIRETQANLIVQPVIDQLMTMLGSIENIGDRLSQILKDLRGKPAKETGYAAGNAINLLHQAGFDLTGFDGSRLTVWQAYLQGVTVHDVDFKHSDLSRCAFTETLGNILWAAFSLGGQLLATCDTDCNVRVWEVKSGKLLLICRGHANWVRFVVFSPDGKTLASCGADRTIKLWNVQDGVCIKTFVGHDHEVFAVAYSPDGQKLASASGDRTVKLWDIRDGHCTNTLTGHTDWVRSVAFSPDGKTLASSGADHIIRVWEIGEGGEMGRWGDGEMGSEKSKIQNPKSKVLFGHSNWVRSIAFSPDGEVLASASSDRTVKLWDYETGDCLRTYTGHQSSVYSITFSPTGNLIISGSGDRTVKLWDCYSNTCVKTLYGQTNEVCCVAVSSDDQTIACVSLDQTMRLWNYDSGHCLKSWYGNTDWALPVAFSPIPPSPLSKGGAGGILASGSNDKTVKLWDWQNSNCIRSLKGHTDFIYGLAFSPDGQVLASASTDSTVRLWQVNTGQCFQILQGHSDWAYTVAFHPEHPILASGSADCTVKFWDWHTGQCLKTLTGHTDKIQGLAFSPDGQVIASGSADQTVRVWDYRTGDELRVLNGHTNRVYSATFSPDSQTLASCSTDHTVKLWNWQTGECLKTFTGHTNWVFSVAFSPDGKSLASASHDQTVRLWPIETGECTRIYSGHSHLVSSVAFSPDGAVIASGSQDQTVRIWNAETGECDRILIAKRLYEGMKLQGVKGLTQATIATLQTLGAIV